MEIAWTKDIEDIDFAHYRYTCKPLVWENKLYYAYGTIDVENSHNSDFYGTKICIVEINLSDSISNLRSISFNYNEPSEKDIISTSKWKFQVIENGIFLFVGIWLNLNNTEITEATNMDSPVEEIKIKSDYHFKNKLLKYNGRAVFECYETISNRFIWKVIVKGFLYTEIQLKDHYLTFGTAGKGGAFYCIDLENGHILTEYINSDASSFDWQKDTVILRDLKGNLVQINPYTNTVLKELKLKDKLFYAPIIVHNDSIITTVWDKKKNIGKLVCVKNT